MVKILNLFREAYEKYYDWNRTNSKKENEVTFENFSKIIDNTIPIE